jgi:hypothetical protein
VPATPTFPASDIGILNALGTPSAQSAGKKLATLAELRRDAFVVDVGGNMNPRGLVARTHLDSPLGPILLAATDKGLAALWFVDPRYHDTNTLDAPDDPQQRWLGCRGARRVLGWPLSGAIQCR